MCAWAAESCSSQNFDAALTLKQRDIENGKMGKEDTLQTKIRLEMMKAFNHNVICIDAKHFTNMYDFLLITVLVVDGFGEGIRTCMYLYGSFLYPNTDGCHLA